MIVLLEAIRCVRIICPLWCIKAVILILVFIVSVQLKSMVAQNSRATFTDQEAVESEFNLSMDDSIDSHNSVDFRFQ